MQGVQPLFQQGKWHVSVLVTGVALFLYLAVELLLLSFVRGSIIVSQGTFKFIFFSSAITMALSPLIFLLLSKFAELYKYQIRYRGLRSNRH